MGIPAKTVWLGDEHIAKARTASGRALIAIGENVAVKAKEHADVISGTMRRSIHTAPANYDGSNDEVQAENSDIPGTTQPTQTVTTQIIEVGSWVPYACVEEVVRGHQFMTPAVQEVQGQLSDDIVRQAFLEQGMSVTTL